MDQAISNLLKTIPVFTTNTDTYHNDKVHSYIGSANYAMGQKCGLAVLYPNNIDVIAGREPPPAVDEPLTFRVYWDASDMLNEGLRQRLLGLNETITGQGAALELFLPTGNPDCPCRAAYPDQAILEDSGQLRVSIDGSEFDYPIGYGIGSCSSHDRHLAPVCDGINPPSFCSDNWCYVDPDNCKAGLEGTKDGGYEWTRTPGIEPPYSYETCGSVNNYVDFISGNNTASQEQAWDEESMLTIVLSSNWARRFMPNVFICGEETVQMPTVPQYGQSPFLQGLNAVSMAIAAGHMGTSADRERRAATSGSAAQRQWKANMGNSLAAQSSEVATIYPPEYSNLSRIGHSVVNKLMTHWVEKGAVWDVWQDARFSSDWIVQHPPAEAIGQPSGRLEVPEYCDEDDGSRACDKDYHLYLCETDEDCKPKPLCPDQGAGNNYYMCEGEKVPIFAPTKCRSRLRQASPPSRPSRLDSDHQHLPPVCAWLGEAWRYASPCRDFLAHTRHAQDALRRALAPSVRENVRHDHEGACVRGCYIARLA